MRLPLVQPGPGEERPRLDYLLLGATVALLVIGTLMVYSASFVVAHNEFNDDLYFLTRHLMWVAIGTVGLAVGARVDYRLWRRFSLPAMLGVIGLLLLVLVPGIGTSSYGAVRWIRLGSFIQIQPSELAKVAIVLYLADWLARRGAAEVKQLGKGSVPFAVIVLIVAGLVELQPDLGTTSIIIGTAAVVFFVAGANLRHVGVLASMGVLGGVALVSRMSGYRQGRISAFLDPWSDMQNTGWHTAQTLIALGSGGLFGLGLGASRQKFYWVPNAHTDAIYAIIGEELGFVGAVVVLALFGIVAWRGFTIAWRAGDPFGRLLATGLTTMIVLQAMINIAVVTNSVPYTGITLPLVSFGGNSIVISMAAIGGLLGIARSAARLVDEDAELPDPDAAPVQIAGAPWPPSNPRTPPRQAPAPRRVATSLGRRSATGSQARPAHRRTSASRGARPRLPRWDLED